MYFLNVTTEVCFNVDVLQVYAFFGIIKVVHSISMIFLQMNGFSNNQSIGYNNFNVCPVWLHTNNLEPTDW